MVDFGNVASGAVSGGIAGASYGGPWGAAAGAVGGGILGLFGSKKKPKKRSTLDKNQQKLYKDYSEGLQGQGQFADLFGYDADAERSVFEQKYAQPAYQNFQQNIVPTITGSFRGGNTQNSSYAGQALSRAGTDVQRGLDANLAEMMYKGQQASIDRRLESLRGILNMQTQAYEKPQANGMDALIGGFAGGAGQYAAKKLFA